MKNILTELDTLAVEYLEGVVESLEELDRQMDGPFGRAVYKTGITVGLIAVLLGLVSIGSTGGLIMLALGTAVVLMNAHSLAKMGDREVSR